MEALDRELIRKCRLGSRDAFEEVVRSYQQYAFKIAYGFLNNRRDAEDMVQEAFITVYSQIKGLQHEEAFPSWLSRIITNLCLRKLEQSKKAPVISMDDIDKAVGVCSVDDFLASELRTDIKEALSRLPAELRVTVVLRDLLGYSYDEISEITVKPLGTVKSRIHQARSLLARLLRPSVEKEE